MKTPAETPGFHSMLNNLISIALFIQSYLIKISLLCVLTHQSTDWPNDQMTNFQPIEVQDDRHNDTQPKEKHNK